MASPEDVAAAFDRVDALLVAAKETAPSVAWLVDRAAANGICEDKLASTYAQTQRCCAGCGQWRPMPLLTAALTWKPQTLTLPSWC